MAVVYLGLGSNLGDRKQYVQTAIRSLTDKWLTIDAIAPLYVSRAWWFDGQEFYNTALRAQTDMDTYELIACIHDIQDAMGRVKREKAKKEEEREYHDRVIDIDILLYDDMICHNSDVTIPHRSMGQRDFVLAPLCAIDPDLQDPMSDDKFADMLAALEDEHRTIIDVMYDWH